VTWRASWRYHDALDWRFLVGVKGKTMLLALIYVLIIIVIGAICFYLIDRFVRDRRLGNLLKILVALFCLAAILQRLLPILGVNF
jgi:uncharacterized membrane protein required for colicin V production